MKKILVIEDNEQNLYLTTFILERRGYEVLQARDGRAGIDLARQVDGIAKLLRQSWRGAVDFDMC